MDTNNAQIRYNTLRAEAQTLMTRLQEQLDADAGDLYMDGKKADWGHVGDASHIVDGLRDLVAFAANSEE